MNERKEAFQRRPRSTESAREAHDAANLAVELDRIADRLASRVLATSRTDFHDGTTSYDAASMAIVRLNALLERPHNAHLLNELTDVERRALGTVRNIITHAGYATMDDESLWETATLHLPDLVRRLRTSVKQV